MSLHRQTDWPWHVLVAEVILKMRISIPACAEFQHPDRTMRYILACSGGYCAVRIVTCSGVRC